MIMRVARCYSSQIGILEGVMQISPSMICLCKGSVRKEISNLVREIGSGEEKTARLIRDDGDKKKNRGLGEERSVEQINKVGTLRGNEDFGVNSDPGQGALWKFGIGGSRR